MARRMNKKTSQYVMETDDASDASSDVDVYLDEPKELPPPTSPPPQQRALQSKRSKTPKRATTSSIHTEWIDAIHEKKYDLTPLGEKSTNRCSSPSTPSYSIDPYEVTRAKEIARVEKEKDAAADTEGYVM
jgi:hypothetical protein